jgi:FSR family fosmidomycin resistance protein-like MFS transporter
MGVLLTLSLTHLLNDLIQSLIPAIYPIIKDSYHLDFVQIGLITFTFQIAGSLFQPAVGFYTDRHPMPYSMVLGMAFTLGGLIGLAYSTSYELILISAASIGVGSSIFHPEATRMARFAGGNRQGLAQGLFQIGGQAGGALGPLLAALIIVRHGQSSLSWFSLTALLAMIVMTWMAGKHALVRDNYTAIRNSNLSQRSSHQELPRATLFWALFILTVLTFSKNAYGESFRSFYTFYLIDRFEVSIAASQLMLFLFLVASAVGALLGGMAGDRIGRYRVIWISVLGPLPLTLLLPHVDLFWTGVLTVMINLIMASAFASILIYAMELVPSNLGLIGGLFYGLNFGLAGIAAAILGSFADTLGVETVFRWCAFLPLVGLLAWFLPKIDEHRSQ